MPQVKGNELKILFTGVVLQRNWPGGEPNIARLLDSAFSAHGMHVAKVYFSRERPPKWRLLDPWSSGSILNRKAVSAYRLLFEKERPDMLMNWYDYDLSAYWAGVLSNTPTIVQAQILWPVCPLSCLYNEITDSPCLGPSKNCGMCLAKRAKAIGELPRTIPYFMCLPFTQDSMNKTARIRNKLKHASAIISDNLFLKNTMARFGFDVSRVHVIYNGVDLGRVEPTYSFRTPKTVLFLSNNVNKQKGFHHFIQVSKNLKPTYPDVRFLWVGQTNVTGPTFETHPYVWRESDLQEIIRSSYLLILPSLWPEAMSYSVIQAMANGKPVVAYDVGANNEAIVHGENGFLAEWGNSKQLSSSVEAILNDEELAVKMGRNARMRAEKMFGLEGMIDSYSTIIENIAHANC